MVEDSLKEIALIIRNRRLEQGYSYEQLSKLSRVSIEYIDAIENLKRDELPEEVYLIGFIKLVLKALKVAEADQLIEGYKDQESKRLIQVILEEQDLDGLGPEAESALQNTRFLKGFSEYKNKYFKVYQVYLLAIILVLGLCFVLLKKFSSDSSSLKPGAFKVESLQTNLGSDGSENLASALSHEKPSLMKDPPKYTLKLKIIDRAWFQIIGIESGRILYEGDVYPGKEPDSFEFSDDIGFVLASGNAGAFLYDAGRGFKDLGDRGELIKWYYPRKARKIYKKRVKTGQIFR